MFASICKYHYKLWTQREVKIKIATKTKNTLLILFVLVKYHLFIDEIFYLVPVRKQTLLTYSIYNE